MSHTPPAPSATATLISRRQECTSAAARYDCLAEYYRPLFARIAEHALAREQSHVLPFEQLRWLRDEGFTALRVPRSHGGVGITIVELLKLITELAAADSNIAHLLRSHFSFVETLATGSSEFAARWYPRVLAGQIFGNAATERGGNALGTTNTTVEPDAAGLWRLNGTKYYTTGSLFADWVVVMATSSQREGRVYAIVEANATGVKIFDDWTGFGQPLTGTGTAVFEKVLVAEEDIIPRPLQATTEPALFQLLLLAVCVGIGAGARDAAAALVRERTRTFNTGSGALFRDDPLIQATLGELAAKVFTAEATVLAAAQAIDDAQDAHLDVPDDAAATAAELAAHHAHAVVPELILNATSQLFDVTGASATDRSKGLDRFWRNARTIATHNPVVFKKRAIGDYYINGTAPVGLNSIGEARGGRR